jgi:septum formation inhibitor-activating ATPase MinD
MNFFQNMLSSIMKSRLAFSRSGAEDFGFFHKEINKATESVMSTTGEVSSIAFAEHLLDLIENHELFFKTKEVVLSNEMKSFKKKNS